MRLLHFSNRGDIRTFRPRPVDRPSQRKAGMAWLNGPLVWAIDEAHQPLYLFPRECPRIVVWRIARSTAGDWARWCGGSAARMVAFVERDALGAVAAGSIFRYELPAGRFRSLDDAGMWVADTAVDPLAIELLDDLPTALRENGAELRGVDDLSALRGLWDSSLHASGIRLRNAPSWRAT